MQYEAFDVAVIGAGHAGCEAALASARLGLKTIVFTVSVDSIAMMPCNPNIGGTSKGHLVREIDALGGEMGKNIDRTFIQSKMLNTSKGPAVHSLRAQADKKDYSAAMRNILENTENLTVRQDEVVAVLVKRKNNGSESVVNDASEITGDEIRNAGSNRTLPETSEIVTENNHCGTSSSEVLKISKAVVSIPDDSSDDTSSSEVFEIPVYDSSSDIFTADDELEVTGVKTFAGNIYPCRAAIMATGVYLNARCITGEVSHYTGPNGLPAATHLTDSLINLGIEVRRFKTGTPARIDKRSIDFSKMEEQFGDEKIVPFSFENTPADLEREQVSCWLTYTNDETHRIIRSNIDRSPLFSGMIQGVGPRYCPSIEDKVMRFADKERHQVFIEPEGRYTNEMYISGMSSSLPEDVQWQMYRSVPGLENAKIVRNAYAIEYDCINATQIYPTLEFKRISGFYSAGQSNGSSGYEEAAAQGIIAGINAALKLLGKEPLVLDRSDGYIGVLIDDLVTKETAEPYRMMTSRSEYRLLLRQDNADLRLSKYGYKAGLLSKERYDRVLQKKAVIDAEIERLNTTFVGTTENVISFLREHESTEVSSGVSLAELVRRPELTYEMIEPLDQNRPEGLDDEIKEQINTEIKYEGYISRQIKQVEQFKKLEKKAIPENFDYSLVPSLRIEARQKLMKFKPLSIGQASRISGVSPADINVLVVYMTSKKS